MSKYARQALVIVYHVQRQMIKPHYYISALKVAIQPMMRQVITNVTHVV